MTGATIHLILIALGLAWLAFIVLVHRKTDVGFLFVVIFYGVGVALLLAGTGVIQLPPVLVTP